MCHDYIVMVAIVPSDVVSLDILGHTNTISLCSITYVLSTIARKHTPCGSLN